MAAELIEAGRGRRTRSTGASTRTCPSAGCSCSSARSRSVERYDDGAITVAHLTQAATSRRPGALETDSEGIVDHMRAVEGTAVAVLVRELLADERAGLRKVSLRATDGRVDVSLIARALRRRRAPPGGRLHHRAALRRAGGDRSASRSRAARRLSALRPPGPAVRQAGGRDLARRGGPGAARARRAARRSATPGTLDPFATGLLLVLVGPRHARAALPDGAAEDLPGGRAAGLDAPTPATARAS